ncbi:MULTISPECIES: hypothetical protein [unclassified Streptomyces]|uniref:hypothetical protein n=1 Tax=unclassified Streptomyces TaxID=2593676 RepID=UPI0036F6CD4C
MRFQILEMVGSLGNFAALKYPDRAVALMPLFFAMAFWLPRSVWMQRHMARSALASILSSGATSSRMLLLI